MGRSWNGRQTGRVAAEPEPVLDAILLAVVFIYLILASLFGSLLQPLAIMLLLPLSFLGVALALYVTKGSINVMSMLGSSC